MLNACQWVLLLEEFLDRSWRSPRLLQDRQIWSFGKLPWQLIQIYEKNKKLVKEHRDKNESIPVLLEIIKMIYCDPNPTCNN